MLWRMSSILWRVLHLIQKQFTQLVITVRDLAEIQFKYLLVPVKDLVDTQLTQLVMVVEGLDNFNGTSCMREHNQGEGYDDSSLNSYPSVGSSLNTSQDGDHWLWLESCLQVLC